MPTFDVIVQGKTYHIGIPDPGATPLQVIVDGEAFAVGIAGTQPAAPSLSAEAAPRPAPQPGLLPSPPHLDVARPVVPAGADGGCEITAPMPGTILAIEVTLGQHVEAGAVVCVLEAMKMKNPIRTSRAGTVAEITVEAGQTVPYGRVLIRLE